VSIKPNSFPNPASSNPPVFTPDNEPYLGRESVFHFDRTICWSMETNTKTALWTRQNYNALTSLQHAGCEILSQGVGIALSIREMIRQAYLFSALILLRSLIERAAVISFLDINPNAVSDWENGWQHKQRPSLATMLSAMAGGVKVEETQKICSYLNHVVHGDPFSCVHNLISLPDGATGFASGKILNNPILCDEVAFSSLCYLIVLTGRASSIFPSAGIERPPEK